MNTQLSQHKDPGVILEQVRRHIARFELLSGIDAETAHTNDLSRQVTERQQRASLSREINSLHPADIAYVLENLPLEQRRFIWQLVQAEYDGAVLLEVSDAVRDTLISDMDVTEIVDAAEHLDTDELADLVPDLPTNIVQELIRSLDSEQREQLTTAMTFPEDTVGALMEFDYVAIRSDVSLDVVLRYLRARKDLPETLQEIMVVSREGIFRGTLPVKALFRHDGETLVDEVMNENATSFHTNDEIEDAVSIFERYDLISAPVLNLHNQLVGVVSIDEIVDYMHEQSQSDLLSQVGLQEEEDLFAPVSQSVKNRGLWLALNLVTAFIASRVIGAFSDTIEQLVILASLMPIVAAVGGNTGNQTLALVIRSFALNQIDDTNLRFLLLKEALVGLISGMLWGAIIGAVTLALYQNMTVSVVLFLSMTLTLALGAVSGVITPVLLRKAGFDPAYGSAVILTGVTDSIGFFIFLGLASLMIAL